jgi:hypothetical protein
MTLHIELREENSTERKKQKRQQIANSRRCRRLKMEWGWGEQIADRKQQKKNS